MIDRLYLDLAEKTSDLKTYDKLFQACQAADEELSERKVGMSFTVISKNEMYK